MNVDLTKFATPLLAALCLCAGTARAEIVLSEAPEPAANEESARKISVPKPENAAGPDEKKEAPQTMLEFANGDKLSGELISIEAGRLRWSSPQATAPIEFRLGTARSVAWPERKAREVKGEGIASIELTNGDALVGKLLSLDGGKLALETWYAGALSIPRQRVRSIMPLDTQGGPIYSGPDGIKGWKVSGGGGGRGARGWRYNDGAFLGMGNGVIGRMFEMPGTVSIDFEMAWRAQLQLAVSFCSDTPDTSSRDSYNMQFNNNYVYVQRMSRDRGSNNLGQSEVPELLRKSPAQIGIRVSKPESTISLLVNGALVKQWTDRGNFVGGGGVAFYTQGSSFVQIKKLRIAKWDGKFPTKSSGEDKSEEDTVTLENSDTVSGRLESIQGGQASLVSKYATLKIPFDRLQSVQMAGKTAEAAKRETGDVRATFLHGGALTLKLESWTGKGMRGTSVNFGAGTFDPGAFEKLDFDPDAKEEEPELMGEGGEGGQVEFVE